VAIAGSQLAILIWHCFNVPRGRNILGPRGFACGHTDGVFNLGAGEVTVLCLLAVIFLGPSKLPDLGERLGEIVRTRGEPRWSWSDWLLVCAAALTFTVSLTVVMGLVR
jgi:hypothetical protein